MNPTPPRRIGATGVHPVGLGLAALSFDRAHDPDRAAHTITAALDSGIGLLDTAHAYTTATEDHHNERLVARSLRGVPAGDRPLVSTKGGHYRSGDTFPVDGRAETLHRHCEGSLRALEVERIDLYHLHWPDPQVPITDSVGALAELRQQGKIGLIGLSNVDLGQLTLARGEADIATVQNPWSLFDPGDDEVLAFCRRSGIAFLAYSPLRGMSTAGPRLTRALEGVAAQYGATTARIALAWLLARSPSLVAVSGATRPETVRDSAAAALITLAPEHLQLLDGAADGPGPAGPGY
ncbi:aldo/keto reductase [Streptomyces sp. NPDC002574]|uniref:aldo/keto reductase n=1 Tax=Streptomyces sp. NPDC002574 TaxID=3364652 RepID=UPI0036B03F85